MDAAQILKTSQEQAVAAWVNFLNQMRLNELLARLTAQDINLEQALAELHNMKVEIATLIARDRGGAKGLHGFIAEAAEVGIENARNLIKGLAPAYKWINDNGPADLLRNNIEIQQKFVRAGGHFGLEAVKAHLEKYPDFIKNGGKYQLPKDFYDSLQKLLSLSQEEATKEPNSTYQLWKWAQKFFEENDISPQDIEPSVLDYSAAQSGKIAETIQNEERNIREIDQSRRDAAYEASKPTLKEGGKIIAASAAMEGGMAFVLGVAKKRREGKALSEFTAEDWKEVGIDTAEGTAKGGIRGAAIYAMTNFTATPAAVANALVTASFGVAAQAYQLRQGEITKEDFVINSEVLCLDAAVSAIASLLGQTLIPVPVLGAVIGNAAGMFMYQIAKDHLSEREQELVHHYRESLDALNKRLEERYQRLIVQLKKEFARFSSMLELAFDPDVNIAFSGSIELADYVGVAKDQVLPNKRAIDNYFLN